MAQVVKREENHELRERVGRAVRWLRSTRFKRQYSAAKAVGVTSNMLCSYETGSRMPEVPTLMRILEGLSYDFGDLQRALDLTREGPVAPREMSPQPEEFRESDASGARGTAGVDPRQEQATLDLVRSFYRWLQVHGAAAGGLAAEKPDPGLDKK